jgi:hypothetical protein
MALQFEPVFSRLREILQKNRGAFSIAQDSAACYTLDAPVGPAALKAWGGKVKKTRIPVAWVEIGKGYVSYHLMGVYGNPKLLDTCSAELRARMQGKSCFNFKTVDEPLFQELDHLTARSLAGFTKAGFVNPS